MSSREYSQPNEFKRETAEDTAAVDIRAIVDDAYKGLKRYWVILLVIVSACSSLFYFHAKRSYTPEYRTTTTFIINTSTAVNYSSEYYNKATATQIARTFPYIISNNALNHMIEEDLGVSPIPGNIEAVAMENTNMITITVTAPDAQMSYDILQSVIRNYPRVARAVIGDTDLNVVEEASVPAAPTNPAGLLQAARQGLLVGISVAVGFLIFYAVTRKTIRREEDFKKVLNLKCLGAIPCVKLKRRSRKGQNRVMLDNKNIPYGFTEAYRTIRTRIERDAGQTGAKVYLVSSAIAGEGKSTVAANLALSLAGKGKKVILVDTDLRNPSIQTVLGMEKPQRGFVDVLNSPASLEEIMIDYRDSGMRVLPGGKPVDFTAGLLNRRKVRMAFESLREQADYVIVDTPPSGLLTDATHIVRWVDGGIFVVRQDYATVERVLDGIEMLSDTGLRLVGCILNCAEAGITSYGAASGYGYRYSRYGKYTKVKDQAPPTLSEQPHNEGKE